MSKSNARFVAIANGAYVALRSLDAAVADAEVLAEVLRRDHQFDPIVLPNLERGPLQDAIDQHLGRGLLTDGTLIVIWIGHGKIGADKTLRLLGHSGPNDVEVASAAQLGEWAARTGARQALVIIDTCYSGGGVVDAARLAEAVNNGRASAASLWFGVLAASFEDQTARSGALVRELIRLLSEGPRNADFRWDKTRPYISGADLVQTLLDEWNEPRQEPHPISAGKVWYQFVRNPRYQAGVPDQPVEHLLLAARGGSGDESYFTGREHALSMIVAWLRGRAPGLFVLTGPPACGKSAVAGRIVSLSSDSERARLLEVEKIPDDLDPGVNSVDAQLHVRGVTVDTASEELARQLAVDPAAGPFGVLGEARRRKKAGDPLVVVIDGLDEARAFSGNLAAELLAPLARDALVLVTTRDVASGETSLISQLGPATQRLDLGQDIEGTLRDVRSYVKRRLAGAADLMDPELVAEELAASGRDSRAAPFLLARLVTSQLREHPVDTSSEGWRLALAASVESALEQDLQSAVLEVAGKPNPTAAREMIRALALAHGSGFPADDVWPAVASAISWSGSTYTRDDAYAVLGALSRHIVAGSESGQPVYRIAHQRLVDYLNSRGSSASEGARPEETAAAVGAAILAVYEQLLDAGLEPKANAYLWRYAWRHLAEADPIELAGMHRLVDRDRAAFLPHLAAALELAAAAEWSVGSVENGLALIEEAVATRRELDDGLNLAMALFHLAIFRGSAGDEDGADEAANEASTVARQVGDHPEGRAVLSAALFARGVTQLVEGRHKAAKLLADEAVALNDSSEPADLKNRWEMLAAACTLSGQASLALNDLETAARMCQRSLDLADRYGGPDDGGGARREALSSLAVVQFIQGAMNPPDRNGKQPPSMVTAGERLLKEHRQAGPQQTVADVSTARGLLYFVKARMPDLSRGLEVPDGDTPAALLNEAVELVLPFAEKMVDAAVVLSEALGLRAKLRADANPEGAASDLSLGERCLRRFIDQNSVAAIGLGIFIDGLVSGQIPQVIKGLIPDLSGLIARQQEAVALLRRGSGVFLRLALAGALGRLCVLLQLSGGREVQDLAIRAEAIDLWRSLVGFIPEAPAQLVVQLVDQAARLLERHSLVESADLAGEAVAISQKLPQPQYAGITAVAELNLAAAQRMLGGVPVSDIRELLGSAMERLEPLTSDGISSGFLALAFVNLAQVEIDDGHFAEALDLAERAVALLDTPGVLPAMAVDPIYAITLGQAQRGVGREEEGGARLRGVVAELCNAVSEGGTHPATLVKALNLAAPDMWDEVLARFRERPDLLQILSIQRRRPRDEMPLTVRTLLTALETSEPSDIFLIRSASRVQRSAAPEEFDAAWFRIAGEVPPWLKLDQRLYLLVIGWIDTPTLALSRDYLKSHPTLLDPGTDIVLDELALSGLEEDEVDYLDQSRELLAGAREVGTDAAYAPLLAQIEIADWLSSDDPEEHLAEHSELLRSEITMMLREEARKGDADSAVFAAILELSQRGERQLAFQTRNNPASTLGHFEASWRVGDITRLAALATIVQAEAQESQVKRKATTALAIARVLDRQLPGPNEGDELTASALDGCTATDLEELVAMVGDAIAHHPNASAELARLIQAIADPNRRSDD